MVQLGISPEWVGLLMAEAGSPLAGSGLVPNARVSELPESEQAILRAGGASGLRGTKQGPVHDGRLMLQNLVTESWLLVDQCHSLAVVASMLQIPADEAETLVQQPVPSLYAFRLGNGPLLFPQWQFADSVPLPSLKRILSVLGASANPLVLARFMLSKNLDLFSKRGPLCPRDWLIEGLDPQPVIQLARDI
tara:strand:- start:3519 stop:4094 length:576 start_codon:yes stop_codon:yes gene_type:complete